MRHVLAFLTAILLLKSAVLAQSDTTTVLKDSVRTVVIVPEKTPLSEQFNVLVGTAPFPYSDLNALLRESRFGGSEEFAPRALGGSILLGFSGQSVFEKWRLMLAVYIQPDNVIRSGRINPSTGDPQEAVVSFWSAGVEISGGYHVFKNDEFALYPFVSVLPQINNLSVEEGENDFFQNLEERFNNSTEIYNSITYSDVAVVAGIGAEKIFDFSSFIPEMYRNIYPLSQFVLGIRAGYSFAPGATQLGSTRGLDFDASGLRLTLNMGYSFSLKKYKAKIISEEK
ncbi:MAG TPA: hypothetical protein VEC36_10915 [Patescibacteria group bacterium]|nr:hypothetical protein [Patescibacteria group bacterium]